MGNQPQGYETPSYSSSYDIVTVTSIQQYEVPSYTATIDDPTAASTALQPWPSSSTTLTTNPYAGNSASPSEDGTSDGSYDYLSTSMEGLTSIVATTTSGSIAYPSAGQSSVLHFSEYPHFSKAQSPMAKANFDVAQIPWTNVTSVPFSSLCMPSGDCAVECRDHQRLWAGRAGDVLEYNGMNITFFELCSNLGAISVESTAGDMLHTSTAISSTSLLHISANIGACLSATCETSRKPQDCNKYCDLDTIFNGTLTSSPRAWTCLVSLCANTCGLPYMDADIMGVGVIIAYIIQACLLMIGAFYVLWRIFRPARRHVYELAGAENPKQRGELPSIFCRSTSSFLAAQCFLGIALQIAVLCSKPWLSDPLTGLGLLFSIIIGFFPTTFTLLLLHTQHCKPWYTYILTTITWSLATANLFLLTRQLFASSTEIAEIAEETLRTANNITTCGESSALALCSSVVGRNPLQWVSALYADAQPSTWPNLKTIYVIWAYSALLLIALTVSQCRQSSVMTAQTAQSAASSQGPIAFISHHHSGLYYRWCTHWTVFSAAVFMFLFGTFYYQLGLLHQLNRMDVLDWDGWSFGQIAAVTVWAPVVVEFVYLMLTRKVERIG